MSVSEERERIMTSPVPYVKQIEQLEARIRELEAENKYLRNLEVSVREILPKEAEQRIAKAKAILCDAQLMDNDLTIIKAVEALEGKE